MSIPFSSLRTKIGLDDTLTFGKHSGDVVLDLIKSRNGYIDYLITQGIKFYPSVHQELKRYPFIKPKKTYFYDGQLRGDIAHNMQPDYDLDLLGDWFDDAPF